MPHYWPQEKLRQYLRNRYREQRQRLIEHLGGKCVKCGSVDRLTFDHIDPEEKKIDKLLVELKKCQLLCYPCNKEKTRADLSRIFKRRAIEKNGPDGFRHGTQYGWLVKKCPCGECYQAKREWHRVRNAKRRKGPGYGERF